MGVMLADENCEEHTESLKFVILQKSHFTIFKLKQSCKPKKQKEISCFSESILYHGA